MSDQANSQERVKRRLRLAAGHLQAARVEASGCYGPGVWTSISSLLIEVDELKASLVAAEETEESRS